MYHVEDSALNKKRGRAHSVEPTAIEVEHEVLSCELHITQD